MAWASREKSSTDRNTIDPAATSASPLDTSVFSPARSLVLRLIHVELVTSDSTVHQRVPVYIIALLLRPPNSQQSVRLHRPVAILLTS